MACWLLLFDVWTKDKQGSVKGLIFAEKYTMSWFFYDSNNSHFSRLFIQQKQQKASW